MDDAFSPRSPGGARRGGSEKASRGKRSRARLFASCTRVTSRRGTPSGSSGDLAEARSRLPSSPPFHTRRLRWSAPSRDVGRRNACSGRLSAALRRTLSDVHERHAVYKTRSSGSYRRGLSPTWNSPRQIRPCVGTPDGEADRVNRTSRSSSTATYREHRGRACVRAYVYARARARLCHREEVPDAAGRAHVLHSRGRILESPGDSDRERGEVPRTHLRG